MDEIPSDEGESLLHPHINPMIRRKTKKVKKYGMFLMLLCLANFFNFTGYSSLSPNLTQIAREFNLTDIERDEKLGRDLNTVYLLISAPVTFLITYLADKMNRKYLFAINTLLCNAFGVLTGTSHSYNALFLYRGLSGITVGASMPILFSLLGDLFPADGRSKASALASVIMGLGMLFGQVVSGILGKPLGWKSPFLLCSIPGCIVGLMAFTMNPPPRGAQEDAVQEEGAQYQATINCRTFYDIFTVPSNVLMFLQGIPGCIPWGVIYVFLPDYLAQEAHLTTQQATFFVVMFGVGATLGSVLGGMMGQWIYNRNKIYLPIFMGVGQILGLPPMLLLMNMKISFQFGSLCITSFLIIWTAFTVNIAGTNLRAILLNVNLPETRSTVISISQFVNNIGRVLGPIVVGWFLYAGRKTAFCYTYYFWLISGGLLFISSCFIVSDELSQKDKVAYQVENTRPRPP